MKKWNKILINKSNKIVKTENVKNFEDYSKEMGGYEPNDKYENKNFFINSYLKGRYLILDEYLKSNLNPNTKTLSIASGRGINELSLISNNFDIVCSDLEIPSCFEVSKKIFGNFEYIKLNILNDKIENKFDNIFSLSTFYIFSNTELEKIFKNVNHIIKKNGTFILEYPGAEDNLISFFFHEIYLVLEAYLIYFIAKFFRRNIGFNFDKNFGYRRKNIEIVKFVEKFGFKLIDISEYDHITEVKRSFLIKKTIDHFPFTLRFFKILGKNIPYIRMFKFKKV